MSPTFIGTQPRAFELNQKTIVPMADEAPRALNFVLSLNDEQKKQASGSTRRTNLIAAAGRDGFIPKKTGLACKQLNKEQRYIRMVHRLVLRVISQLTLQHLTQQILDNYLMVTVEVIICNSKVGVLSIEFITENCLQEKSKPTMTLTRQHTTYNHDRTNSARQHKR